MIDFVCLGYPLPPGCELLRRGHSPLLSGTPAVCRVPLPLVPRRTVSPHAVCEAPVSRPWMAHAKYNRSRSPFVAWAAPSLYS
eukprot:scaffold35_cov116-Isochrysis_galbana.AAC.6